MGWALPVAGVTVANGWLGHDLVIVAWNGGINLFLGNNPSATGWSATAPELRPSWWLGYLDAIQITSRDLGHQASPSEVSAYWTRRALAFVASEPLPWLRLMARKAYLLVSSFEFSNNQSIQAFFEYSPFFRTPFLGFGLLVALAAPQLLSRRLWREPLPWFLAAYSIGVIAFFITSRYRQPIIPLLAVLASATLVDLIEALIKKRWRALGKIAVPVLIAAWVSSSDWADARDPDVAQQHFSLANRLAQRGDLEEAIAEYERAIRLRPYHMGAWNNIATVKLRQGRIVEAQRVLEQSIDINPTAEAYARLGVTYLRQGRIDSAHAALGKSLALTPDNPEALYYVGHVAVAEGEVSRALATWEKALLLHPDPELRGHINSAILHHQTLRGSVGEASER